MALSPRRLALQRTLDAAAQALADLDRTEKLYPVEDPYPNGTVLRFKVSLPVQGNNQTYSYVGFKRKGRWYVTGRAQRGGYSWDDLRAWFADHNGRDFVVYARDSHAWDPKKISEEDERVIIEYLRQKGYVVRWPDQPHTPRVQYPEGTPPVNAPRCTHGGDCPVHPEIRGLHDIDLMNRGWAAGPAAEPATAQIAQAFNRRSGDPAARGAMDSPDLFQDMCAVYGAQMTYRPILDRIFQAASRAAASRATVGNRDVEIWIHAKARFDRLYHPATTRDPEKQHAEELDADGVDPRSGS